MKNTLYKLIIKRVTNYCYQNCLECFSQDKKILDVGIGNGVMLKNYHSQIKSKNLQITGIDINKNYLKHCDALIKAYDLENFINIYHESVENYEPPGQQFFDFILFSMSFMLFGNQQLVLDRIRPWLQPGGNVIFFQTMYKDKFPLMEVLKPKLKHLTTIDFGKVTYEKEFFELLEQNNLSVSEDRLIKKEWFKGEYRMIITSFGRNHQKETTESL